jgi:hypothetical protein
MHGGKRQLESPDRFKMVLSEESVKWIELSRHIAKRKAFAITAIQIEANLNLNPDEGQTAVHFLVQCMYNI